MKITKQRLKEIIKEELSRSFDDSRPVKGLNSWDAWNGAFLNTLRRMKEEGTFSPELYADLRQRHLAATTGVTPSGRKLMDLIKTLRKDKEFNFDILKVDTEEWMEPSFRG
jgi:hypothetical protein